MEGATHPGDVCIARTGVKWRTQYMKEWVWNSMLEAVRNNEGYEDITLDMVQKYWN